MHIRHLLAAALIASAPLAVQADQCKPDCGRITAISHYEQEGEGSGVGMVAGGVAGALLGNQVGKGTGKTVATVGGAAGGAYLGNMAEKKYKAKKMTKITVKMDNGSTRTIDLEGDSQLANGDRVQFAGGTLKRYTGK